MRHLSRMEATATKGKRTARFERRRAEILNVASNEINLNGVSGLTLTAVARALALDTSSVTYYFRLKEELAAACIARSLAHLTANAAAGADEPTPSRRISKFVAEHLELYRLQREPTGPRLAVLSDMGSLEGDVRAPLDAAYSEAFQIVRGYLAATDDPDRRSARAVASNVLIASVLWASAWISQYDVADLTRVSARLSTVLLDGLEAGAPWPQELDELEDMGDPASGRTRFLHAATQLVNRHGYKGASVDKIAAELGVSVGSFYHHLEGKDELVLACFDRSFAIVERARQRAEAAAGSCGQRLGALINLLVKFQFSATSPLLRTSAYQVLPVGLREQMLQRNRAFTLHLAGLIADGIAEGSIRPVDPLIASHVVIAMIYAASDMRAWASRRPLAAAVTDYARSIRRGIIQVAADASV